MAVSALAVAFNTGTGAVSSTIDVTGSITISGTSVVIFFQNGRTETTDTNGRATRWRGCGWAVSATDRRAQISQDADAAASHTGGSYHTDAACIASNSTGTATDGLLDFDSWLSNGFRLIVDDVMPRSYRMIALIITGLSNAQSVSWQDTSSTGNKVVTSGLSFQPDVVFGMATTIDTTAPGGRAGNENLGLGFALSSTARAVLAGGSDEGSATTDTDSYSTDTEFLATLTAAVGSVLGSRMEFVSMNSNGFTINQLIIPSTLCWNHFLAIKGGLWSVQSVTTKTDTTTDINTGSLGFAPAGAIIFSAMKTEHTAGTPTVHDTWSVGVASSASDRYALALRSEDGLADTQVFTAVEHDEVYIAISSAPAVEGLMDVKTWADPITFIMDDADPSAKFVTMLVVGNAGATISLNTASLTASGQNLTIIKGAVTKSLNTAALIAGGQTFTVRLTTRISLNTANLTAGGQNLTIIKGAIVKVLNTVTLTASGQNFTIVKGAVVKILNTAVLTANGQTFTVRNVNIISLNTATLTSNGQTFTVIKGAVVKTLNTAALIATERSLTIIKGAVVKVLNTAVVNANGQTFTVSTASGIHLSTATLTANGQVFAVVKGAVIISLNTAVINVNGQTFIVIKGAVTKVLNTAALAINGQTLVVIKGAVIKVLNTAALAINGQTLTIVKGGVIIPMNTAGIAAYGVDITIPSAALAIIRAWTLRNRDIVWSLDERDLAWTLHTRRRDWSLDEK